MMERTLVIIKPNATRKHVIGKIIARYEEEGLFVVAMRTAYLEQSEAEDFYREHREKPFFRELVDFMTSDEVVLVVLEGEDAVRRNREIMGSTNPDKAAPGTLRRMYADSLEANAVHGSDSLASAQREIAFFFKNAKELKLHKVA